MEAHKKHSKGYNLLMRCMTSLILIPMVLLLVYSGGYAYKIAIITVAILMAFEWSHITASQTEPTKQLTWKLIGLAYILMPTISMIWLRDHVKGREVVFWLLATIWATDIAAYFVGSTVGGWKIMPSVSPNKTWSGLVGGLLAACLVGYATADLTHSSKPVYLVMISGVLGVYGQVGDFVESWIKRKFGVKDSGKMLPGHGGILDRVDSLVPVAPKVAFLLLFDKWGLF